MPHHVLHLILPKRHLANDRLSGPLGGHGKRSRYLLLFTPVMLPLHYGPPWLMDNCSAPWMLCAFLSFGSKVFLSNAVLYFSLYWVRFDCFLFACSQSFWFSAHKFSLTCLLVFRSAWTFRPIWSTR